MCIRILIYFIHVSRRRRDSGHCTRNIFHGSLYIILCACVCVRVFVCVCVYDDEYTKVYTGGDVVFFLTHGGASRRKGACDIRLCVGTTESASAFPNAGQMSFRATAGTRA